MRWIAGYVFFVLLLGLPLVQATEIFSLNGNLHSQQPFELQGALAVAPQEAASLALVTLQPHSLSDAPLLVEADKAELLVVRWEEGFSNPTTALALSPIRVTSAHLFLEEMRSSPQFFLSTRGSDSELAMQGSTCQIQPALPSSSFRFPEDSRSVSQPEWRYEGQSPSLLADCSINAVESNEPAFVHFYGLDLLLSSKERTERIQTGTFEETDPTGLFTKKVTQILQVRYAKAPFHFQLSLDSHVRLQASAFQTIGTLKAGTSEGNLVWGPASWEGPVDAFEAFGLFEMNGRPENHILVRGTTLDHPTMALQTQTTTLASSFSSPILVLVGLGASALFLYALWGLFSKLSSDQVLQHPRRSSILEFIRTQPGVEANTVARSLNLQRGVFIHHLETLRREGHVVIRNFNGRTALFPANSGFRGKEAPLALLRRTSSRNVYELLQRHPGSTQRTLATSLGLTMMRISQLVQRLEAAGLVHKERCGRCYAYFANETPTF